MEANKNERDEPVTRLLRQRVTLPNVLILEVLQNITQNASLDINISLWVQGLWRNPYLRN